ncbi:MAG: hydrogenobyrinic acid a,c-diamide synthase (glutamine-hydrolyzing) [Desulfatiglandales bacterium]|jgi:cobyrinic acid a,c-diamide synthase|nr:hydrogenobyrinic acid a,c-diamide synthase (glutamine-hydrolyzing) [Desulfatiglandales bacterium]
MVLNFLPRIIIAALKGGSGKTILSLGLTAAWRKKDYFVAPFKKGPDFIDSGWLAFAANRSCHNLDPFLMTDKQIMQSFFSHSAGADISLIEGNRGLFDGFDLKGSSSTAELGKLLKSPVIIIVDVTMVTRTSAALIMGCQQFDPSLNIVAVILNRVAGSRQESIVRGSIERYCGIPVIGAVPKLKGGLFPERHMGLIPQQERKPAEKAIAWARTAVEENLDLKAIWSLAHDVEPLDKEDQDQEKVQSELGGTDPPRVGFIRDGSFKFYYPENLEQLKNLGAVLVEIDSIADRELPDLDGLYIGGGFPETQAEALADNRRFRESLKQEIQTGLPVYAECGGLMYLGESLLINEKIYPMVGALPLKFVLEKKPQGHGYTILEVNRENPYYPVGEVLRGHEFHYSRPLASRPEEINTVFKVRRGIGLDGQRDGLCKKNLLATYTHLHAAGNPLWGKSFFKAVINSKNLRTKISNDFQKEGLTM